MTPPLCSGLSESTSNREVVFTEKHISLISMEDEMFEKWGSLWFPC